MSADHLNHVQTAADCTYTFSPNVVKNWDTGSVFGTLKGLEHIVERDGNDIRVR
jgi:hypothetical protein